MNGIKNNKTYTRLKLLRRFFHIMGIKPPHIFLPLILSFVAASFDTVGLGLLIPVAKGMVSDFDFVKNIPLLKNIITIFLPAFAGFLTPNKATFLLLVIMIFISILLKNAVIYVNNVYSSYWNGKFKRNMYKFVFDRFLSFGKLFFDKTNQGYLNVVLNYSEFTLGLLNLFRDSVYKILTLIAYFVIMFFISWKLTIITMFSFPLLYYLLRSSIKSISNSAHTTNIYMIELSRNVFNILTCIPLIKAYSREDQIKRSYANINEQLRKVEFNTSKMENLIMPIQEVVITTILLLMISIVALLLTKDKPSEISIFVVFFYAARKSLPMFGIFNQIKVTFVQAKPPIKELFKIADDKDKFFVIGGNKVFDGLKNKIDFVHLSFSYIPEVQILKDISFSIEKGKVTAIVGPTGAGKTTLINLLMRFYDCPPASIMIDGADIRSFTLKSLRQHMALVSQEIFLFNDTMRNNIVFGLDKKISENELIDVAKKVRIYDFIKQLPNRFNTDIGDRGIKLSGGEKQRLAIARALLKGSEILILDEATSSLDTQTEKLIQEAINEAIKDRTAIVIAHRLSTIKNADKIVVIERGRLVEEGSLNELLDQKSRFYEYWEVQKFY